MTMNTNTLVRSITIVGALLTSQIVVAQAPAGAPAGTTGLCKDGTYYTGASKQGACRGHQGVKEWYGESGGSSKAPAAPVAIPPAATPTSPAAPAATAPASTAPAATSKAKTTAQAPGGGADKVWLNTATNVYHCPGTRYYGTTKAGTYMTEAEAKAKGAHPDHNKPCQ